MNRVNAGEGRTVSELRLRVLSAILLGMIVLTITWIGGYTFSLLWSVIALAILFEYVRICGDAVPYSIRILGLMFLSLVVLAYHLNAPVSAEGLLGIAIVAIGAMELVIKKSVWGGAGLAYSGIPFIAMSDLRVDDLAGFVLILILFGCVWGADILAYFAGRGIGGPKLAPKISPNKTWSGFIGGVFGALALATTVAWVAGYYPNASFFAIILILAVVSQIGDLMESMLKRTFDVKDSGSLIPGHGGVLDRIDGLIIAGALLWLVLIFMQAGNLSGASLGQVFENTFLTNP